MQNFLELVIELNTLKGIWNYSGLEILHSLELHAFCVCFHVINKQRWNARFVVVHRECIVVHTDDNNVTVQKIL